MRRRQFAAGAIVVFTIGAQVALCAKVTGPVTGGEKGRPWSTPTVDVESRGYVVEEFFLDGEAAAYQFRDGDSPKLDGQWETERREKSATFRSRMLVVRPKDGKGFNGTVIVHWQNVTAGFELGNVGDDEYLRGFAWVGVSAQKVGVDGFAGQEARGLKQWDPERYGSLKHPGDGYSYDIFTQAARAVGADRTKDPDPMGGLDVKRLVAAGASQSAHRLRTYINGVHHLEKVFHGFIPYIDFAATIPFGQDFGQRGRGFGFPARIRTDLDVPVFVVNTETETLPYVRVRQPDSKTYRFWEVAGASHVAVQRGTKRDDLNSPNWHSYTPAYDAAVRHMHAWVSEGKEPPRIAPIDLGEEGGRPRIVRDDDGNAKGGLRLPDFAVPTAKHSGMGRRGGNRFAFLYGTSEDFDAERLKELYPTRDRFLELYDEAIKRSIDEGTLLKEDGAKLRQRAEAWSKRLE